MGTQNRGSDKLCHNTDLPHTLRPLDRQRVRGVYYPKCVDALSGLCLWNDGCCIATLCATGRDEWVAALYNSCSLNQIPSLMRV
ncbi:MAG: hypothetical protein AAF639_38295 [Chloroflexota bacterium]